MSRKICHMPEYMRDDFVYDGDFYYSNMNIVRMRLQAISLVWVYRKMDLENKIFKMWC